MSVDRQVLRRRLSGRGLTVAIDGPSGSGKSTAARNLAQALGIGYLDTGAMYRALTWEALRRGTDLADGDALAAVARAMPLRMRSDPRDPHYWVGDVEVTRQIREPRVSTRVSEVASHPQVRRWMVAEQRRRMLAARGEGAGMVAEGRDITTVVCPDADVRVLLIADAAERLARRTRELYGDTSPQHLAATRREVQERDARDSAVTHFLKPAPGVATLDNSRLQPDEVLERLLELVEADLAHR